MKSADLIYEYLIKHYYAILTLAIIELITLVFGALIFRKLGELKKMYLYVLVDFSILSFCVIIDANNFFSEKTTNYIFNGTNSLVSFLEIVVYYIFFHKRVKIKKSILIAISTFAAITIITRLASILFDFSIGISFKSEAHFISTVSFLLIFPMAVLNLINFPNVDRIKTLYIEYEFWITIGILYYSIISTPYYFLRGFFKLENSILLVLDQALFFSPFILNIFCILIAFVCKMLAKK